MNSTKMNKGVRQIHSSQSYDRKYSMTTKKQTKRNLRGVFIDEVKEGTTEEEDDQELNENNNINIVIIYNHTKLISKFNKNKTIEDFINHIKIAHFKKVINFKENFVFYHGSLVIPFDDKRKLRELIGEKEKSLKLTLKSKEKNIVNMTSDNKIYVELENIPSFMDLSNQINLFLAQVNYKNKDFDISYKDNCCRILFASSEIAFSFVAYMTKVKFSNKYYRKLKIDIKYNQLKHEDYEKKRYLSTNEKQNNGGQKKNKKERSKYVNYKTEGGFDEHYESLRGSCPYGYENEIAKIEDKIKKKQWMVNKNFFSSINKNSFNSLISPAKYYFPKGEKFRLHYKNVKSFSMLK